MPNLFGGGKSETVVEGRALSTSEISLIEKQIQLANAQLSAVQRAMTSQLGFTGVEPIKPQKITTPPLAGDEYIKDGKIKRRQRGDDQIVESVSARLNKLNAEQDRQFQQEMKAFQAQQKSIKSGLDPIAGLLKQNISFLQSELKAAQQDVTGRAGVPGAEQLAKDLPGLVKGLTQQLSGLREAVSKPVPGEGQIAKRLPGELDRLFDQFAQLREDVLRGPTASPEDRRLIEEAANRAIEAGLIDIERFQTEGLEQIRNVLAPARGLRPGDSPIIDRGGQIVREATRQAGQLISGARGQQALNLLNFPLQRRASDISSIGLQSEALGSFLNFPLQRQALNTSTVGTEAGIIGGFSDFQAALRDQAFRNRLLLGSALGDLSLNVSQQGIGLATGIPANVQGTLASIAASSGQRQTSTAPGEAGVGLANIGALSSGAGALITALSSSRTLKDRVGEIDPEALLARVKHLSTDRWRWKDGMDCGDHCGPYAEELKDLFGVGNGKMFPIYDVFGVLFAMVKALEARTAKNA